MNWNDGKSIALCPEHLSGALRVFIKMRQSGAMLWLPKRPPTECCSRTIAGGNEEVGKTVGSHCGDAMRRSGRLLIRQACARDLRGKVLR